MNEPTWTLSEVAQYLGYTGKSATGSARKQLHRWNIQAFGRQAGRGGESYYLAKAIKEAHARRPGQGHRSDIAKFMTPKGMPQSALDTFHDATSTPGARSGGITVEEDGRFRAEVYTDRVTVVGIYQAADQGSVDSDGVWEKVALAVDGVTEISPCDWRSAYALLANADALVPELIQASGIYTETATPSSCTTWPTQPAVPSALTGAEVLARIEALRKIAYSRFHYETGSLSLVQEWIPDCHEHQYHAWTYTPREATGSYDGRLS